LDAGPGVEIISAGSKAFAMLLVGLGLLIALLYGMKRFSVRRESGKGGVPIKVLSTFHFSPKERIEVVDIDGERIVLGIGQGNIHFLTKLLNRTGEEGKGHE
jgi:flagellar biogenesis protein FliO